MMRLLSLLKLMKIPQMKGLIHGVCYEQKSDRTNTEYLVYKIIKQYVAVY